MAVDKPSLLGNGRDCDDLVSLPGLLLRDQRTRGALCLLSKNRISTSEVPTYLLDPHDFKTIERLNDWFFERFWFERFFARKKEASRLDDPLQVQPLERRLRALARLLEAWKRRERVVSSEVNVEEMVPGLRGRERRGRERERERRRDG